MDDLYGNGGKLLEAVSNEQDACFIEICISRFYKLAKVVFWTYEAILDVVDVVKK